MVLLGAVAGESFFGSSFRVGSQRGRVSPLTSGAWSGLVVATIHPSAVLRASDEDREAMYDGFVADLKVAWHVK